MAEYRSRIKCSEYEKTIPGTLYIRQCSPLCRSCGRFHDKLKALERKGYIKMEGKGVRLAKKGWKVRLQANILLGKCHTIILILFTPHSFKDGRNRVINV